MMVFSYKSVRKKYSVTKVIILNKLTTSGMIFIGLMSLKIRCIFVTTTLPLNWFYLTDKSLFKSEIPTKRKEGGGGDYNYCQKTILSKNQVDPLMEYQT